MSAPPPEDPWIYQPPLGPLPVVHEDRDLIVVDKPSGLLSVPGRGEAQADCALARLRSGGWPTAGEVHRLDLDTSGLIVFSLRGKAQRSLMAAFRERRVQKRYLARVWGDPADDAGLIELPLSRAPDQPRSFVDPARGRPSRTRWAVLERSAAGALLELWPETGRSHQLRVHLLALGHPILGDRFYAPPEAAAAAPRLLLHAAGLVLPHPWSGAPLVLERPAPF